MPSMHGLLVSLSCVTILLAILLISSSTSHDAFCSVEQLQQAALADRNIESILHNNLYKISSTSPAFVRILAVLNEYSLIRQDDDNDDIINVVGNPLHAFQIIRRLTISIPDIQDLILNTHQDLWSALDEQRASADVSVLKDLNGAASGLFRLQKTYLLYAIDLSNGKVWNVYTMARLTLYDCLFIAMTAKQNKMLEFASEWVEAAELRAKEIQDVTAQITIASLARSIKVMHDESFLPNVSPPGTYSRFYLPLRERSPIDQRQVEFQNKMAIHHDRHNWKNAWEYEAALCRGQRFLTDEEEAKLSCATISGPHPFFYMQPHKVEVQSLDPLVVTIHDVLRDRQLELLKSLGLRILERSTVVGTTVENPRVVSDSRISMTAWLQDGHPEVLKISKRVSMITGLDITEFGASEQFQVVNYGIAGQYHHHFDFFHNTPEEKMKIYNNTGEFGDRIATFLIYLSDVEQGGGTAFLSAGVAVKPVKGSATFWYNLDTDGNGSTKTKHAGCPVVTGSKWIANKWFHEKAQMFIKPCPLYPGISHSFETPPGSPSEILQLLQ